MTGYLDLNAEAVAAAFPERPFAIRHSLADNPLFTLPRLVQLARSLDRDQIEYSSGDLAPDQDPETIPTIDLPIEETIQQIEHCHAWMVIKTVEKDPEYRHFLDACLTEVASKTGADASTFQDIRGFIFVSSANSVTPFHVDAEHNFFVQIHGDKAMHIFDNHDRSLVSEEDMEISPSKHRNQHYDPDFEQRATVYDMAEGDGVFLPYMWPHWVCTGERYSVSMAITWKTPEVVRLNKVRFMNAFLRKLGAPQSAPGRIGWLDGAKALAYDVAFAVLQPLRKSEWTRRVLRQMLFGRKANYYYET